MVFNTESVMKTILLKLFNNLINNWLKIVCGKLKHEDSNNSWYLFYLADQLLKQQYRL